MAKFAQTYKSITDQLEAVVTNATIVDTAVALTEIENSSNGMFDPYVAVSIGGPIEAARGRHITDRRMNVLTSWVTTTIVAPRNEDSLLIKDQVIDALWGFSPYDAAPMIMTGGTAHSVTNEQAKPIKFMHTVMFQIYHNVLGPTP